MRPLTETTQKEVLKRKYSLENMKMTSDYKQLVFAVCYSCILLISYIVFRYNPEWRIGGIAWNNLFLIFGPTIGSLVLIVIFIFSWTKKQINLVVLVISIIQLLIVSTLCFIKAFNIMMGI